MVQAASYPPLQRTQGRGTLYFSASRECEAQATRQRESRVRGMQETAQMSSGKYLRKLGLRHRAKYGVCLWKSLWN